MKSWYDRLKSYGCGAAGKSLGMETKGRATRMKPCPACKNDKASDGRPPVHIYASDTRWHCNACNADGNIFDLVSYKVHGCTAGELPDFSILREWLGDTPMPETVKPKKPEPPDYPPIEEVSRFIHAATPTAHSINHKVNRWLEKRGLDRKKIPAGVACRTFDCSSLTEVTTSRGNPSPWWPKQWKMQYPVIIPLVDWKGNLVSLVGRSIGHERRKTSAPIGYSTKNLVNATLSARRFMQKLDVPEKIWITEGEMDYLAIAQSGASTIGIRSGSIGAIQMLGWQEHQTVFIATDNDRTGEMYAEKVAENVYPAMAKRVRLDMIGGGQ